MQTQYRLQIINDLNDYVDIYIWLNYRLYCSCSLRYIRHCDARRSSLRRPHPRAVRHSDGLRRKSAFGIPAFRHSGGTPHWIGGCDFVKYASARKMPKK